MQHSEAVLIRSQDLHHHNYLIIVQIVVKDVIAFVYG